jgi:hypothetical protein
MRSIPLVLLSAVLLAGCNSIGQTAPDAAAADAAALATHLPPNYRQLIAEQLRKAVAFVGVKDAEISNPVPKAAKLFDDGAVTVCVRFHARIRPDWAYSAYLTTALFTFYNGTVSVDARPEDMLFICGKDRTYTPFPEGSKEYTGTDFQPFPGVNNAH